MLPPPASSDRLISPVVPPMAIRHNEPSSKRPRVRHTEIQLQALNQLYDQNEHPSLDERAALAENLGMDPKAVNAWFANKRSATKKKTRAASHPYSVPSPSARVDDDEDEEEDSQCRSSRLSTPFSTMDFQSVPTSDSDGHRHVFESEAAGGAAPRRMRIRPTPKQREELERVFETNKHPSREEREALGDRIGMRHQSVTNWFQNMRSVVKKRVEDQEGVSHPTRPLTSRQSHQRQYGAFAHAHAQSPEPAKMPPLPPAASHPSLSAPMQPFSHPARPAPLLPQVPPRDNHTTPQSSVSVPQRRQLNPPISLSRPRRTRPEPFQLEALKKLFARTTNPSIEERGALALEIGMDIGKVTNWFRNLRQTARKRALKATNDDDAYESMDYDDSAPVSVASTPLFPSSSSVSVDGDVEHMDLDGPRFYGRQYHQPHSDGGSEEDYEEAVTPPPALRSAGRRRMEVGFLTGSNDDLPLPHSSKSSFTTGSSTPSVPPPSVEDALLLLSFSKRSVRWYVLGAIGSLMNPLLTKHHLSFVQKSKVHKC